MKKSINKLKLISTRDTGVGTSDSMKKTQETCHHRAIHPLHDDPLSLSHSFWCNHSCDSRLSSMQSPMWLPFVFSSSPCRCALLLLKSLLVCFTFVKVFVGILYLKSLSVCFSFVTILVDIFTFVKVLVRMLYLLSKSWSAGLAFKKGVLCDMIIREVLLSMILYIRHLWSQL